MMMMMMMMMIIIIIVVVVVMTVVITVVIIIIKLKHHRYESSIEDVFRRLEMDLPRWRPLCKSTSRPRRNQAAGPNLSTSAGSYHGNAWMGGGGLKHDWTWVFPLPLWLCWVELVLMNFYSSLMGGFVWVDVWVGFDGKVWVGGMVWMDGWRMSGGEETMNESQMKRRSVDGWMDG